MPCYHPIPAWQTAGGSVVFWSRGDAVRRFSVPCGQCVGCRLERSRQWAVRCMHEASLHEFNCFLTLTYNDQSLPPFASLRYEDFQKFMKRLRRRFSFAKLKFYMCGEYGETTRRPHYHALLFGLDFLDKVYWKKSGSGSRIYTSKVLSELWPFGDAYIGAVTFESAAYCARYCVQKVTGDAADAHYRVVDRDTGEVGQLVPEFNHMSLRPAIGHDWLRKFGADVYPHGSVVVNGVECKAPRFYDKKFEASNPEAFLLLQERRQSEALSRWADNVPRRLRVREVVQEARLFSLKRDGG